MLKFKRMLKDLLDLIICFKTSLKPSIADMLRSVSSPSNSDRIRILPLLFYKLGSKPVTDWITA